MNRHILALLALPFLLLGCEDSETDLRIGSKNFSESRILAEMILALAEKQNVPTSGIVTYETTPAIMAAIKSGAADIYPEYNGTGLVMLGQNPMSDGAAATARVKELYGPLGLTWLDGFGFANNYGLAMREDRAAELGVEKISDLVPIAGDLTIATEDDFMVRPLDGFEPMTLRYAMSFGEVDVLPLEDRNDAYDKLINGDVDVAEVYTTDGQIAEYSLVVLEDDLGFFPIYEAMMIARADALSTHPGLGPALAALAGKISPELMRELNGRVDLEGRSARAVARDALARLDLIDAGAVETQDPLLIATEPSFASGPQSALVLRAVQRAFTGRDAQFASGPAPLSMVASGEARLALVGADAFYDLSNPAPERIAGFEAVAAVGQSIVHLIAPQDGPRTVGEITRLAVGAPGSSSARIGGLLTEGLRMSAETISTDGADVLAALASGEADAALVMAPEGDAGVAAAVARDGLRLIPLDGWNSGANLVRFPFLREARIAAGTYRGQTDPVETLRTQLVLAGPAPQAADAIGDQGPGAVVAEQQPITGSAVTKLNASFPSKVAVDPALPLAASLAPKLPQPPAALNPSPGISVLSFALCAFLVWLVWLLIRPEYR